MNDVAPDAEAPPAAPYPQARTSRLAVIAALAALLCVPGLSGVLGVALGLLALRQINTISGLEGHSLAWFGILGGLVNLGVWGAVGQHVLQVRSAAGPATESFLRAWTHAEADGEKAASPGLAALMHHGEGPILRKALVERFGGFLGLGPRRDFHYSLDLQGEHFSAAFPLKMANGAPCSATFEYVSAHRTVKVVGFHFESPLLRDLGIQGHSALHGVATPDVQTFSGGSDAAPTSRVKSFDP